MEESYTRFSHFSLTQYLRTFEAKSEGEGGMKLYPQVDHPRVSLLSHFHE